jgi:hypothetical protein
MQLERLHSLNHSVVELLVHLHHLGLQASLSNLGKGGVCWLCESVHPYAHPPQEKGLNHLKYV